ncbi:MAG: hypothetical protein RL220_735 [Bacteroidota bacterium]
MYRLLILISFSLSTTVAFAQIGGQAVYNSLRVPASAREAALGGGMTAMKDGDISLSLRNPSLLDSASADKVSLGYIGYFAGTNVGVVSYGRRINEKLTGALSVQYFSFGKMDETDASGNVIGSFSAGDFAVTAGAGYKIDSLFSLGGGLRFVYSNLAQYTSAGIMADLAATYHNPAKQFTAAIVVNHLGTEVDSYIDGQRSDLPVNISLGLTKKLPHAPFRFNVMIENLQKWKLSYDESNDIVVDPVSGEIVEDSGFEFGDMLMRHIRLGTEFDISKSFQFRFGYDYRRRQELGLADKPGMAGFSYGFGIRLTRFSISYGRAIYHLAGPSHHLTLSLPMSGSMR